MNLNFFKAAKRVMGQCHFTGRITIGCVIVYKGSIIAMSPNMDKTSPVQRKYNDYRFHDCGTPAKTHAEIGALKKIRWLDIDFSKVYVYTYRENRSGNIAMARPCPSCLAYIKQMGIHNICYTTNDGYVEERLAY